MLPFTVLFVVLGWGLAAVLSWIAFKGRGKRPFLLWAMALCFFAAGAFPLAASLLESAKLYAVGIALTFGTLLAVLGVEKLLSYMWCTVPIRARVARVVQVYSRRGPVGHVPVFSYCYAGKNYESQSLASSKRRTGRVLMEGEEYEIFVDPRRPENCADKCCRPRVDLWLLLLAFCFLLYGFFLLLMPAASITIGG